MTHTTAPQLIIGDQWLSASTSWGDLEWGLCWPGYSDELTFDVSAIPGACKPGASVLLVWGGEALWGGTLEEPVRGERLRASGLHRLGENYAALDGSGNPSALTDTAVPVAIGRGLPWSWKTGAGLTAPINLDTPVTISELVDAQTALLGGVDWGIDPRGTTVSTTRPTPRLHLRPGVDGLGIAWDGYCSTIVARYKDSTSGVLTTVIRTDAAAADRWGYKEHTLTTAINDGAAMTLAQAEAILDSLLAHGRSRPGWTTNLEVEYGDVVNNHGQSVELATIKPWEQIRIQGLTDDVGDLSGRTWVDMPLARINHDGPTTTLTPVGLVSPMLDALEGK